MGSGLGALTAVAAIGLTVTSASQIDAHFDALAQSQVSLQAVDRHFDEVAEELVQRSRGWPGVEGATLLSAVNADVQGVYIGGTGSTPATAALAIDEQTLRTLEISGIVGADLNYAAGHGAPVALVGAVAARELELSPPYAGQAISIAGHRLTVIGRFDESPRDPELLTRVFVPQAWARAAGVMGGVDRAVFRTRLGAAQTVAGRLAHLTSALAPNAFLVSAPPTVEALRDTVRSDLDVLTLATSGGALAVGALGIANAMLIGVLRRRGEFALRRALGGTSMDVWVQVLVEGALLGVFAGLAGTVGGVVAVVAVSAAQSWSPILDVRWLLAVTAASMFLGAAMSGWPAARAARIEPAEAIREL